MTTVVGLIVLAALVVYALTGVADFGGGVWDLLASGPTKERQRGLVAQVIAPIWEANHVWLILVVVLGFVCLPVAFARVTTALHVPLVLVLIGIVLRGAAFVFRAYDPDGPSPIWGRVFAGSSLGTPLFLGVVLGAIIQGVDATDFFAWSTPFAWAIGGLVLALSAWLSSVYLSCEAAARGDDELADAFRTRSLGSQALLFLAAFGALFLAQDTPIWPILTAREALGFHGTLGAVAIASVVFVVRREWTSARAAAITQVVLMVLGWGVAQFPYALPPDLTLEAAAAPPEVLSATVTVLAIGSLVLVPSFVWLYRTFNPARDR